MSFYCLIIKKFPFLEPLDYDENFKHLKWSHIFKMIIQTEIKM